MWRVVGRRVPPPNEWGVLSGAGAPAQTSHQDINWWGAGAPPQNSSSVFILSPHEHMYVLVITPPSTTNLDTVNSERDPS